MRRRFGVLNPDRLPIRSAGRLIASVSVLIQLFARAPVPGAVKTRLAAGTDAQTAADWHRRLLLRTLSVARAAPGLRLELWVAGDPSHPFFLRHCAGLRRRRQIGGDLGRRMAFAARSGLQRAEAVILIGSDCPVLAPGHLRAAAHWLRQATDAVLIPAEDGGYVLLGLRRFNRRLFERIDWGGERVAAQTRARLSALRWQWRELPALWDLDRPQDLLRSELQAGSAGAAPLWLKRRTMMPRSRRVWR